MIESQPVAEAGDEVNECQALILRSALKKWPRRGNASRRGGEKLRRLARGALCVYLATVQLFHF
jgi:hypothetical protein